MRRISFIVSAEYDGRKVQQYLREKANCSSTLIKTLKQWEDGILLNGLHIRTIDRLKTGDYLEITIYDMPKPTQAFGSVEILYEDEDVIVFNKPAGMPCHQSGNRHQNDTLANAFAALCKERGEEMTFRAVNRLDRNTTGAVLVAKNAHSAALLAGKVEKIYLAVTQNPPNPLSGIINAPIGREEKQMRRMIMENGQNAVTVYETLYTDEKYSLIRCELPTGRTHQIRVHMAYLGCPLLGDELYSGNMEELTRQALHCAVIRFHTLTQENTIEVTAPIPKDMQNIVKMYKKTEI